jgi:hypothetical protein
MSPERIRRALLPTLLLVAAAVLSTASPKKSGMPDDPFLARSAVRSAESPPEERRRPPRRGPQLQRKLPYPACPAPAGVIQRHQLLAILDRTPGVFLQGVDVTRIPTSQLPGGKHYWKRPKSYSSFGGWYLRRFHPGDPCLDRAGLRTGDIIADVNGSPLSHPDDLVRLWQSLRTARRIIVRLYRRGHPLVFVVKIADTGPRRSPLRGNNR